MKTRKQIIERAHRVLGVLSYDEALTAEQLRTGGEVLDSVFARINAELPNAPFAVEADVPDEAFVSLSDLLAAYIAPDYALQAPVSRARAWLSLRAIYVENDWNRRHAPCAVPPGPFVPSDGVTYGGNVVTWGD